MKNIIFTGITALVSAYVGAVLCGSGIIYNKDFRESIEKGFNTAGKKLGDRERVKIDVEFKKD